MTAAEFEALPIMRGRDLEGAVTHYLFGSSKWCVGIHDGIVYRQAIVTYWVDADYREPVPC